MNERQDPYDPYAAQEQQLIGYDAYGRPVYGQVPVQPAAPAQQYEQQQYGCDYQGYGQQPPQQQQYYAPQPAAQEYGQQDYAQAPGYGYDTQQTQQWIPQQVAPQQAPEQAAPEPAAAEPPAPAGRRTAQVPEPRRPDGEPEAGRDYRTEMFAFIDQPDEDSEDVIDWLKFTESRTERREEARRRGRNRVVALIVVLALFVVGGLGYLWYAGKLPFLDRPGQDKSGATAAAGAQKRDMIVVHLHNTKKGGTSSALLVDNVTTKQGATVLLPNALGVTNQDGSATALGKAVEEGGLGTREALDSVLGTQIGGTWRLDTPFLENLVELVGGIEVDTDTAVPADDAAKTPAVAQGQKQSLSGPMAVAYATYRGQGEPETKQLERVGKVLQAVLRKVPSDPKAAAVTVESIGQILDPALNAQTLGALLARLGEHAKVGAYRTDLLAVKADGTLTDEANKKVVKEVLGGSVAAAQPGASPRVGLKDATGDEKTQVAAKATLLNGGYTFVDGGKADKTAAASQITYQDDAQRDRAIEVAKTLGLPETVVKKAENVVNAEVVVILGKDYKAS
ncbi:LCP family protein [Streptomyces sp. MB09-01]|uniref:LCP family protein n=1 Tax=Streptomyces sp. MB09-01 TaxID=3028666 RepID=UPI0029B70109|nr:LCP family protein [Streptomyces sp. MB09-01]MDX3532858.1 LCP family protein [Streptomyces sp. MB09-01]